MPDTINLALNHIPASSPSKPHPRLEHLGIKTAYDYLPSADGVDTNLLIMFHGLGDTTSPFTNLAKTLKLPQTSYLILQGFERVPLLEEEAYQWWDSFDPLTGDTILNPNPSKTLSKLNPIFNHLTSKKVGWNSSEIHLFGFGQGGSCVTEFVLNWNRTKSMPERIKDYSSKEVQIHSSFSFGSLVTVSGPLLSLPTISPDSRSQTPTLLWVRKHQDSMGRWRASFSKGFEFVEHFTASIASENAQESMPRGKEWDPIIKFWSKHLKQRNAWELSASKAGAPVVSSDNSEIYQVNQ